MFEIHCVNSMPAIALIYHLIVRFCQVLDYVVPFIRQDLSVSIFVYVYVFCVCISVDFAFF